MIYVGGILGVFDICLPIMSKTSVFESFVIEPADLFCSLDIIQCCILVLVLSQGTLGIAYVASSLECSIVCSL